MHRGCKPERNAQFCVFQAPENYEGTKTRSLSDLLLLFPQWDVIPQWMLLELIERTNKRWTKGRAFKFQLVILWEMILLYLLQFSLTWWLKATALLVPDLLSGGIMLLWCCWKRFLVQKDSIEDVAGLVSFNILFGAIQNHLVASGLQSCMLQLLDDYAPKVPSSMCPTRPFLWTNFSSKSKVPEEKRNTKCHN